VTYLSKYFTLDEMTASQTAARKRNRPKSKAGKTA
jgi:hypothetical protein